MNFRMVSEVGSCMYERLCLYYDSYESEKKKPREKNCWQKNHTEKIIPAGEWKASANLGVKGSNGITTN